MFSRLEPVSVGRIFTRMTLNLQGRVVDPKVRREGVVEPVDDELGCMNGRFPVDFHVGRQGMHAKSQGPYVYMVNISNAVDFLDRRANYRRVKVGRDGVHQHIT